MNGCTYHIPIGKVQIAINNKAWSFIDLGTVPDIAVDKAILT